MANTNSNSTTNTETGTTKKDRTYSEIKKSIISNAHSIKSHTNALKTDIIDAIIVLKAENKDRKAIKEQLKNDFVNQGYVGRTLMEELVAQEFATPEQIQKMAEEKEAAAAKKRITIGNDGQQVEQSEGGDDEESQVDFRERMKQQNSGKNLKKAVRDLKKNSPSVQDLELENAPDDDDDNTQQQQKNNDDREHYQEETNNYTDETPLKEHGNNVVIDDKNMLKEIAQIIESGKSVTIVVNKNLVPESLKVGSVLS